MTNTSLQALGGARMGSPGSSTLSLATAVRAAAPALLFGLRLWASVCLALYVAFWLQLDEAHWAGTSAAIMCQPRLGASLRKGWFRMIGTVIGAVAIVVLTAFFPQERGPFLVGLALWGAACAAGATLLRNFAAYAAALAGYTTAIIAYDLLGATGGPHGEVFMLAVTRTTEICIGIVSAGIVLAGTDLGGAERRLAASFAALSSEVAGRFARTLERVGTELREMQSVRRELARRVSELDPVIDEAIGESSQLRYHSAVLQRAVDGLFAALAGWRTVAGHLEHLPDREARKEASVVLKEVPGELRAAWPHEDAAGWLRDPVHLRSSCEAGERTLQALPAGTPSLRLLADQTAGVLGGLSHALDGLAVLAHDSARPLDRRRPFRLQIADWLPSLVNAVRAFVTIGAVALFWIATAWPHGALAITWAAIPIILFSPRADRAYSATVGFMLGNAIAVVFAAVVLFALLPAFSTFPGFALAIGLYLVPVGALLVRSGEAPLVVAMAANFMPLLGPANQMSYDTEQFYNTTLAIVAGNGAAALAIRLLPPLSPALRTRRLLTSTLRDLRRIATGPIADTPDAWEHRTYARLWALPDEAEPLQRARLLAALAMGTAIVRLRHAGARLGVGSNVDEALEAFAQGRSATAAAGLDRLDRSLASRSDTPLEKSLALRTRGTILGIVEALGQHASYFDAGATA